MSGHPVTLGGGAVRVRPARLALLLAGPVAVAVASWVYLAVMIGDMSLIPGMRAGMMHPGSLDPAWLFGLVLMWSVMMAAMMLPTAVPMLYAYARMRAMEPDRRAVRRAVVRFAAGYLAAWTAFSVVAAVLQLWLSGLALLSPMTMQLVSAPLAGSLLVLVGLYQLTPLKQTCLRQCQTPTSFLMTRWRDGPFGSLAMGWEHGRFCVGCCWALMALLFVAGVMNPAWIIAITVYVLVEKLVPGSARLSQGVGIVLVGAGLWVLLA